MGERKISGDNFAEAAATGAHTVVAVATAPGEGAVGIVRLTGSRALAIAEKMFASRSGRCLGELPPRQFALGAVVAGGTKERVDEVLAVFMPGPRSFTGEDLVELHAHGNPFILQAIVQAALAEGAVPAGPGEFTRRAFLNGRLDLAQAEAVIDLIRSRSETSRAAALHQLDGGLSRRLAVIDQQLLELVAPLEAALEFGDEDGIALELNQDLLQGVIGELETLVGLAEKGRAAREGLLVVLLGKTNVGKSSIINRLCGCSRSIVTSEAGTTRDTVESRISFAGFPVTVVDTAGFGAASGPAEKEGMLRSREASRRADILVPVFDLSRSLEEEDRNLLREHSETFFFALLNKSDLAARLDRTKLEAALPDSPLVALSALTGDGFETLRNLLEDVIRRNWNPSRQEDTLLVNARHGRTLGRALAALRRAEEGFSSGSPADLVAADLAAARSAVGEITGQSLSDGLLDEIFNRFCVGK